MTDKKTTGVVGAVVAITLMLGGCLIGLPLFLMGGAASASPCGPVPVSVPSPGAEGTTKWNDSQVANAAIIVAVGQEMKVPARGLVIALATAMQESTLRNLNYGDRDSVGLFQQRPSQGWGTVAQLTDPRYASGKFYTSLLKVEGWQGMRLTDAAQAVQNSGTPEAYQQWQDDANALAAAILKVGSIDELGGGAPGAPCGPGAFEPVPVGPGGWVQPVRAGVVAPWGQDRGDHRHAGVDLGAGKKTPIRAAAAGVVSTSKCNAPAWHGCDSDGYPGLGGCGWYVDVRHAGNIATRYCHMIQQPFVQVGQKVAAGEVLGLSGSSGNSSGPHLHYEVHRGVAPGQSLTFGNSVDPVAFMAGVGAPLGG
ncbi:M23 family metallopeptidase [Micromonospora lupini]|uniref:M23 family metallopeptidase n=1 Tax=Micromonospora lupini TaxID=285679 RepID=UPI00225072F5|nr:M23 family metallopeptidase [Micromonospora lupini]MCX5068200.1 M23 family metallopeptidase [Micromonospora lupini]